MTKILGGIAFLVVVVGIIAMMVIAFVGVL